MAKVINNVVKMDWDKDGWYQISANNGKKQVFVFASHEYDSTLYDTPVTVFFTPFCAFVMETEEGLWNADEFKTIDTSLLTRFDFPVNIDGVTPIIEGGSSCDMEVLNKYGLEAHVKDIDARRRDVRGFGEEQDVDPASLLE